MRDIGRDEGLDPSVDEERGDAAERAPQSGRARRGLWVAVSMLVAIALVSGGLWG